jgi:replicative DNA helicase
MITTERDRPISSREPPKDLHAEKCLIGSVLLFPSAIDEIGVRISQQDFYLQEHGDIWGALLWLSSQNKPLDPIAIADRLKATDRFDDETYALIEECMQSVPHGAHSQVYAGTVDERSRRRLLSAAGTSAVRDAYEMTADIDESLGRVSTSIGAILERSVASKTQSLGDVLIDAMNRLTSGRGMGLMTGFQTLDGIMTGLQPGNVAILAARPSIGKTAFAVNIGLKIAQRNIPVGMLSMEQSRMEIAERLLSAEARLSSHIMRGGGMSEAQIDSLVEASARLGELPFMIDESLNRSISALESSARLMRRRDKIELLVVDYLQLATGAAYRNSREQEVAECSRRMKGLAKSLGIPILCLAQVNRESEKGTVRPPRLSDLRESGSIEADADAVWLMHRPDVYDANDEPGVMYLNVAKHRNGPIGEVKFMFDKSLMTFRDAGKRDQTAVSQYSQYASGFER